MATASDVEPLKRSSSYEWLPPHMSELRVVLLGNNWSKKTSVGNLILDENVLNNETTSSVIISRTIKDKEVTIITTPDHLLSDIKHHELMKLIKDCSAASRPGPHVFLLVLQPEDFTEEHKWRIESFLKNFSDQSFNQTLVLLSSPRKQSLRLTEKQRQRPPVKDMIRRCRYRSVQMENLVHHELLTRLGQIVKENDGEHLSYEEFKETPSSSTDDHEDLTLIQKGSGLMGAAKAGDEDKQSPDCLRIVLIGKTGSGKSSLGNTILGRKAFKAVASPTSVTKVCEKMLGQVDGRPVAVVDTPGLFNTDLTDEQVQEEMEKCISVLAPGPHVFLLVLPMGRFTQEEKQTLKFIKEGFGKNAEKFTIILLTHGDKLMFDEGISVDKYINECNDSFKKLLSGCGGRYHVFNIFDEKPTQVTELMKKIDSMVKENGGRCFTNETDIERLLKEKEEEMRKQKEELERKYEEKMMEIKKQMEETERERKQREQQLREMEENIKRERKQRKKEQEEREEEDRQKKKQDELQQ